MPDLIRPVPGVHCMKRQNWAYDGGICLQPAGHEKRCRFVWDKGVEVDQGAVLTRIC